MKTLNDITHEEYLKLTEWLSASKMMYIKTPAEYIYNLLNPIEQTPDMIFGAAFHCLILEPHKFDTEFPCLKNSTFPVQQFNKDGSVSQVPTENRKHLAAFVAENLGKTIITESQLNLMKDMKEALLRTTFGKNDNTVADLLEYSIFEQKYEAYFLIIEGVYEGEQDLKLITKEDADKHPIESVIKIRLKVDIDCELPEFTYLADIKTTQNVNIDDFSRIAWASDLPIQASLYLDVLSFLKNKQYKNLIYPAVEKTPPYLTDVFFPDAEYIEYGRRMYKKRLITLKKSIMEKKFKGYDVNRTSNIPYAELSIPAWAYYREKINF